MKIRRTRTKSPSYSKTKASVESKRDNPYLKKIGGIATSYTGLDPNSVLAGDVSQALTQADEAIKTTENMEIIGEALRRQLDALARQAQLRKEAAEHTLTAAKTIGQSENAANSRVREFIEAMTLNVQQHDIEDAYGNEKTRFVFQDNNQSFQAKLKALVDSRNAKLLSSKDSELKKRHKSLIDGYRRELKAFADGNRSPMEAMAAYQSLNGVSNGQEIQSSQRNGLLSGIVDTVAKVVK